MNELYKRLGIAKDASQADIKKAYRSLAKKLHPDRNPNNKRIAERFKGVSAAYSLLSNESQRGKYDRGEIDENGNRRANAGGGPGGFGAKGFGPGSGFGSGADSARRKSGFGFNDAEDIFSDFFRFTGRKNGPKQTENPYTSSGRSKGLDISYQVIVGFEESITGGSRRLKLNDGRSVDINVPGGIKDGQVIRLSGQGGPGVGGAPKGDALVEVQVSEHPYYKRDGDDILLELPISISEAILGGDIQLPTPTGRLTIRIPRNSSSGNKLRLKGKGVQKKNAPAGNMYISLKITLPENRDLKLEKLIKDWEPQKSGDSFRKKAGLN